MFVPKREGGEYRKARVTMNRGCGGVGNGGKLHFRSGRFLRETFICVGNADDSRNGRIGRFSFLLYFPNPEMSHAA